MYNEGIYVVVERFIRIFKNKSYKYTTSISKNVSVDKLDDIIKKYNTYHRTTKMQPVDIKLNTYINTSKEINDKNSKFKIDDIVRIQNYKNIFGTGYISNWSEEVSVIKKVKKTVPSAYLINYLNVEEIVRTFYKNKCKKQIKKSLELKK